MSAKCLVIGGTGAQGAAVVRVLSATNRYDIVIMTRNASSSHARDLAAHNVSFLEGNCFNELDLVRAFEGIDCCYVNLDGFAVGEKAEVYWSIRVYEIALWAGVKHFVYGGIDYCSRKAGFDPKYRCGHYDGKGKVGDFLQAQPTKPMMWSILCSGPYIESLDDYYRPQPDAEGVQVFRIPLADGAMPLIHLADLGRYALWILDNPSESNGMNLEIATAHTTGEDMARAYTAVTGKPARYEAADLAEYMTEFWSDLPDGKDTKIGGAYAPHDDTLMSFDQNFTAWWNIYQACADNKGIIRRDYELLDKILPDRIKSVEEWMKKTKYTGELKPLLKDGADRAEGK